MPCPYGNAQVCFACHCERSEAISLSLDGRGQGEGDIGGAEGLLCPSERLAGYVQQVVTP